MYVLFRILRLLTASMIWLVLPRFRALYSSPKSSTARTSVLHGFIRSVVYTVHFQMLPSRSSGLVVEEENSTRKRKEWDLCLRGHVPPSLTWPRGPFPPTPNASAEQTFLLLLRPCDVPGPPLRPEVRALCLDLYPVAWLDAQGYNI